jgi:hypothetical protein
VAMGQTGGASENREESDGNEDNYEASISSEPAPVGQSGQAGAAVLPEDRAHGPRTTPGSTPTSSPSQPAPVMNQGSMSALSEAASTCQTGPHFSPMGSSPAVPRTLFESPLSAAEGEMGGVAEDLSGPDYSSSDSGEYDVKTHKTRR